MVASRFRCASALVYALLAGRVAAGEPLRDDPVRWHEDDRRHVAERPAERDPSLTWDLFDDGVAAPVARFFDPTRAVRWASVPFGGNHVKSAQNVNRLDEAPNSSWFTNRIGLFPLTVEAVRRGPEGRVPSHDGPWTIVRAKTEGVTPGFTIRDARGDHYLIKFDPPGHPAMTTAAGVISQRIFHAAGYNVPDDNVVHFRADELVLDDDVKISLPSGARRAMTDADIEEILERVHVKPDGSIRAIASRFVDGRPIGPFSYDGTRDDDPNDRIPHRHRRELRGIAVFAAWINHFDTKQHNSLDAFVQDGDRSYVRHYLIDFASTLGSGAYGPAERFGWEYTFDPKAISRRILTLGLAEDDWRRVRRPEGLDEIAYFDVEQFDPAGFAPLQSNPAFVNLTRRDGYWAAKIVSAFTDEHLRAIVDEARYENPAAADYMVRTLAGRRDEIARHWFAQVAPLDFFTVEGGVLRYRDLGAERGLYPGRSARYRARVRGVDDARNGDGFGPWAESTAPRLSLPDVAAAFLEVECAVDRGDGWSKPIAAYIARASGRVALVERDGR